MATVTILSATQLTSASGSGSKGSVEVKYNFSEDDGDYNTILEFRSDSNNWAQCFDVNGTINTDVASTSATILCYWESIDQRADLEGNLRMKIIAFKS